MAEAPLSAENQDALDDLLVAIETGGRRLGILIAVCDDSQLRAEIIIRYEQALAPTFRHYQLTLDRTEPSLKALLTEQVKDDEYLQQGGQAVMTILGSDRLLTLKLDQARSEQETFFGYLQWTREGLTDFPFAIVLWVTYQMQEQLSRKAPDFWSWRRDVVRFVSPKRNAIPADDLSGLARVSFTLPEEVGNTLPVADLEALIENTTAKSPNSPMLASLHLQAGKAYANRLAQGTAQEYETEVERATTHLEKAARLLESSEPSEDYASSLDWLANVYQNQGRHEQAEPLYEQALALRRKLLGEEHPDVANSLNNLAALYDSQGRYEQAEPLYEQALALRCKLLGEEHSDVAASLNNLAGLYSSQGRCEQAEPLYEQALALYRKLLGEEHPAVATSLNNLAGLYDSQGRYEQAESLYQQALTLRRKLLGEEHPDVATSLNNLAGLYDSQGRYGQAEPLYLQAIAILIDRLGHEHPNTQAGINNFEQCITAAVQAGRQWELSDHPMTQQIIASVLAQ
ncbi:MAG: tetratricopeptide repeat protein [Phormidesmis sp.]